MWYIILFYIVIFKLPVSTNQFQYRSIADMTNIHRTKLMLPVEPAPPEPVLLLPNHEPTTCIAVGGRYEGGIYRDQETVCNTVQRRPETRRQVTPTTQMLRYSRVPNQMPPRQLRQPRPEPPGMIQPQMMLPKQSKNNPQNVARTPRQVMMPKLRLRASLRPGQQPTLAGLRQPDYHTNEGNKEFQEYQLFPQVLHPDNENRDHQEYQLFPQDLHPDNENRDNQEYQSPPQPIYSNDGNGDQQELYVKAQGSSTSTAAPVPSTTRTARSTTSTMPPFPGGFFPGGGSFSGEQGKVCGDKAKCNQYVWTTRKKTHLRTTEAFLLWTP